MCNTGAAETALGIRKRLMVQAYYTILFGFVQAVVRKKA